MQRRTGMGRFVNPGNGAFQADVNAEIYVDKTGLLRFTNQVINTNAAFICNSRPRRFGKSVMANMLAAYYSKGSDSKTFFPDWIFPNQLIMKNTGISMMSSILTYSGV